MSRHSIETRDVVKGLVIVDVNRKTGNVKIYVRESLNETIVSQSEVTLTRQMFFDLIDSAYDSLRETSAGINEVV